MHQLLNPNTATAASINPEMRKTNSREFQHQEMELTSSECPLCAKRFRLSRARAYLRHVESHGTVAQEESSSGCRAEREESEECAMRPADRGGQQVTGGLVTGQQPGRKLQTGLNGKSSDSGCGVAAAAKRRHRCEQCGKRFSLRSNLKRHLRVHSGERPFRCIECNKRFSQSVHLKVHIAAVHRHEKPHECKMCGQRFATSAMLRAHHRTHTGEKPFACSVCDRRFSECGGLSCHSRVHTGEKPFACSVCDRRFSLRDSLIKHSRVHTGEKPFACSVCDMRFNQSNNLIRHSRVHTGQKPFACSVCDRRFNQSSSLIRHSMVHTGVKPFACSVCDRRFCQSSQLVSHSRVHTRVPVTDHSAARPEAGDSKGHGISKSNRRARVGKPRVSQKHQKDPSECDIKSVRQESY